MNQNAELRGTISALKINKTTKRIEAANDFQFYENGQRVYSPANKPSPADLNVYSKPESDAKFYHAANKPTAADCKAIDGISRSGALRAAIGWQVLARVRMPQSASTVRFSIYGGAGFNTGNFNQCGLMEVICRSGNNNPKGITIVAYNHGGVTPIFTEIAWKLVSGDDYDIYVKTPNQHIHANRVDWYGSSSSLVSWGSDTPSDTKPSGVTDGRIITNYNEQLKPTAVDVGALPLSGGTVTGLINSTVAGNVFETQGGFIRSNASNIMSLDGKTYSFVTSRNDAHLCQNAYWDGQWKKYDNASMSGLVAIINGELKFHVSDGGNANPYQRQYMVYHQGFKPTAADVGLPNVPNTVHSTNADANTVAVRDHVADLHCRLVRSGYPNQSTISGALAFRVNNGSDNYVRFCSDTAAIRTWLGVDTSQFINKSGGTLTGNLSFSLDNELSWARNTDYAKIGFKNASDADTDSFMYFKTGDNGNEYFKWQIVNGSTTTDLLTLKSDHLRFKGNAVYHQGFKPTAADVGALPIGGGTLNGSVTISNGDLFLNATSRRSHIAFNYNSSGDRVWLYVDPNQNKLQISAPIDVEGVVKWKPAAGSGSQINIRNWGTSGRWAVLEAADDHGWHWYSQRVSAGGAVQFSVNGQVSAPSFAVNGLGITNPDSASIRINSPHGYLDLGPKNASFCHIYTDRDRFAFNQGMSLTSTDSTSWVDMRTSRFCYSTLGTVNTSSASAIVRQEHADRHFILGGLGNSQFGIYMINKDRSTNGTDAAAYLQNDGAWVCNGNGNFNDVYIRSDKRLKSNIELTTNHLEKILKLKPVAYDKKETLDAETTERELGLIAQDVEKIIPLAVGTGSDEHKIKALKPYALIATLIGAVKELAGKVEYLESQIR